MCIRDSTHTHTTTFRTTGPLPKTGRTALLAEVSMKIVTIKNLGSEVKIKNFIYKIIGYRDGIIYYSLKRFSVITACFYNFGTADLDSYLLDSLNEF